MNIKQYCKRVIEDCMNSDIKSKPFINGLVSAILISLVFSPFIGILLGMMITSHYVQKEKSI